MYRPARLLPMLVLALSLGSGFATAQTVTVPSGKTSQIGELGMVDPATCNTAIPEVSFAKSPDHGKIATKRVKSRLGDEHGACAGRTVTMVGVFYTPAKGFKGADTMSVQSRYSDTIAGGAGQSFDITIEVR